ncbi:hypothetical protein GCM10027345_30990 [Hymenobacter daeguensis]
MGGLGGGVHNGKGAHFPEQVHHALAVADIELMMTESAAQGLGQAPLICAVIALRAKEYGPLIVVEAMHFPPAAGEKSGYLRANKPGRPCDEY